MCVCVYVCARLCVRPLPFLLADTQDPNCFLRMAHFWQGMVGLNWMLGLSHLCMIYVHFSSCRILLWVWGKWNNCFSSRYHSSLLREDDQNSMFLSHPLFFNFPCILHFSFMNTSIPITMLIASVSPLLSCLILLICGQFSIRQGEHLNSAVTKLHAWVSRVCIGWAQNPQVQTAPPLVMVPNGVCSDLLNHSAVNESWWEAEFPSRIVPLLPPKKRMLWPFLLHSSPRTVCWWFHPSLLPDIFQIWSHYCLETVVTITQGHFSSSLSASVETLW